MVFPAIADPAAPAPDSAGPSVPWCGDSVRRGGVGNLEENEMIESISEWAEPQFSCTHRLYNACCLPTYNIIRPIHERTACFSICPPINTCRTHTPPSHLGYVVVWSGGMYYIPLYPTIYLSILGALSRLLSFVYLSNITTANENKTSALRIELNSAACVFNKF